MNNNRRNLLKTLSVLPLAFMQKKEDADAGFGELEDDPKVSSFWDEPLFSRFVEAKMTDVYKGLPCSGTFPRCSG